MKTNETNSGCWQPVAGALLLFAVVVVGIGLGIAAVVTA